MKNLVARLSLVLVFAFTCFFATGCASTELTGNFHPDAINGATGKLPDAIVEPFAVGDLVTVKFSDAPISPHIERVKEDGTITLPFIGAVQAEGKTPKSLQDEIRDRYVPRCFQQLSVTVTAGRNWYFVGGYVRSPGLQSYLGAATVTKAIESAGGFTDYASRSGVQLAHADGKTLTINCVEAATDASLDLPVYPGDKIYVPGRGWLDLFR